MIWAKQTVKVVCLMGLPLFCLAVFIVLHDLEGIVWSAAGLTFGIGIYGFTQ
jgi:hypothetical protein